MVLTCNYEDHSGSICCCSPDSISAQLTRIWRSKMKLSQNWIHRKGQKWKNGPATCRLSWKSWNGTPVLNTSDFKFTSCLPSTSLPVDSWASKIPYCRQKHGKSRRIAGVLSPPHKKKASLNHYTPGCLHIPSQTVWDEFHFAWDDMLVPWKVTWKDFLLSPLFLPILDPWRWNLFHCPIAFWVTTGVTELQRLVERNDLSQPWECQGQERCESTPCSNLRVDQDMDFNRDVEAP